MANHFLKPFNDDNGMVNKNNRFVKQLQDITDEEGLKRAYGTKDYLYHRYNKLFIAGTNDFPVDHTDDLKL